MQVGIDQSRCLTVLPCSCSKNWVPFVTVMLTFASSETMKMFKASKPAVLKLGWLSLPSPLTYMMA